MKLKNVLIGFLILIFFLSLEYYRYQRYDYYHHGDVTIRVHKEHDYTKSSGLFYDLQDNYKFLLGQCLVLEKLKNRNSATAAPAVLAPNLTLDDRPWEEQCADKKSNHYAKFISALGIALPELPKLKEATADTSLPDPKFPDE